jgi:hypothetical protein
MNKILLLLLAALSLASCEETLNSDFTPQLVLEGYLYANEPLDSVVIRRTLEITETDSLQFVQGATVTLSYDDQNIRLIERPEFPGAYFPPSPLTIEPRKTYRIRVEAMGQVATSETTVPDAIALDSAKIGDRVLNINGVDTIEYPGTREELSKPGVRLWWTRSQSARGYGMEAVTFDSTAEIIDLDPEDDNLPDSNAMGRYRFFILSNSEQILWRQFRRYGENTVRALALDQNLQDFLTRSQFDNNTLRVQGGLGVFGSAARASMRVYVRKTLE